MNSIKQFIVLFFAIQCLQLAASKPIFKGLSLKKNYEVEISAIPIKHITFFKEKWFPFKMFGIKHDIAKREVVEDPRDENLYSVNEENYDHPEYDNFPGPLNNIKNSLDVNSDSEIIPVVDNIQPVHIKPVIKTDDLAAGIVQTSSVIPISPSFIIAPSIHTMGTVVQPSAVVPIDSIIANSAPKEIEVKPIVLQDEITPIQPLHTQIDVPSVENLEASVSKMHTDISSAVPLNTLVASPVQEMDLPLPVDIKVEKPPAEITPVITSVDPVVVPVVESPAPAPVVEPPAPVPIVEPPAPVPVVEPPVLLPEIELPVQVPEAAVVVPGKSGPVGLIMRGTRFALYFGSVMLQLLSQMISHSPISLSQVTEPLALK